MSLSRSSRAGRIVGEARLAPLLSFTVNKEAGGTIVRWDAMPGALAYSVVRGEIVNLRESGSTIRLGQLACAASGISRTGTEGHAVPTIPPRVRNRGRGQGVARPGRPSRLSLNPRPRER